MIAHVADDPVGGGFRASLSMPAARLGTVSPSEIRRHLRRMDDAQQREWWERWLESYWTHRLDGIPKPLDDGEIGVMIGWLPVLNSLFSTAVELAVGMRSVSISTNQTIYDLLRGDHGRDSPEAVAKLLIHLGEHASLDPAWHLGRELIDTASHQRQPAGRPSETAARAGRKTRARLIAPRRYPTTTLRGCPIARNPFRRILFSSSGANCRPSSRPLSTVSWPLHLS